MSENTLWRFTARRRIELASTHLDNRNPIGTSDFTNVVENFTAIGVTGNPDLVRAPTPGNQQFTNCLTTLDLSPAEIVTSILRSVSSDAPTSGTTWFDRARTLDRDLCCTAAGCRFRTRRST